MNKIKIFLKKHFKKFIAITITASMCFVFLFSSAYAAIDNYKYEMFLLDLDYITCQQVSSLGGAGIDFEIREPNDADDFTYSAWLFRKTFDIKDGTILNFRFSHNFVQLVPEATFYVEIPFSICFIKNGSESKLKDITQCIVGFQYLDSKTNQWSTETPIFCNLEFSPTGSSEVVALKGVAKFNLPLSAGRLFSEFLFSFAQFNGVCSNATSYAFAFGGPITFRYGYKSSVSNSSEPTLSNKDLFDSSNNLSSYIDRLNSISSGLDFSSFRNIINKLNVSFSCIGAIWNNFLARTGLKYIFEFSLIIGLSCFGFGIGSIFISSINRNNRKK